MTDWSEPEEGELSCGQRVMVVAYLDGELAPSEGELFERHAAACPACASDLAAQRVLLCTLNFALERPPATKLPANFAEVVKARAQADLRGLNEVSERRRALKLCLLLGSAGLALCGAAAGPALLTVVAVAGRPFLSALRVLLHAGLDAAASAAVVFRAVERHLFGESGSLGLALFLLAGALLPLMILRYHRHYHRTRLSG